MFVSFVFWFERVECSAVQSSKQSQLAHSCTLSAFCVCVCVPAARPCWIRSVGAQECSTRLRRVKEGAGLFMLPLKGASFPSSRYRQLLGHFLFTTTPFTRVTEVGTRLNLPSFPVLACARPALHRPALPCTLLHCTPGLLYHSQPQYLQAPWGHDDGPRPRL